MSDSDSLLGDPTENAHIRELEFKVSKGELREETVDRNTATAMVERVLGPMQPGIYVEIGPGFRPYAIEGARWFSPQQSYIAYEGGQSKYRPFSDSVPNLGWIDPRRSSFNNDAKGLMQKFADAPPNWHIRLGDAQDMSLPDATPDQPERRRVREVYMNSVMIAPGMHPDSIERILNECARILDSKGQLVIRDEQPTDSGLMRARFLELFDILDKAGFKKRTVVSIYQGSRTMEELARQFDDPKDTRLHPWMGSYIICEKGEQGITPAVDPRGLGRKFMDFFRYRGPST